MEKKRYFRLIFQRTFRCLGWTLVIALLAGTLLGGGYYTVSALCAAGFVMICRGWFAYLKMTGMQPFGRSFGRKRVRIPWMHRRQKEKRTHSPSFAMDSADFDDDLTAATMVSEEEFSPKQQEAASAAAHAACGVLLVIFSFLIPM